MRLVWASLLTTACGFPDVSLDGSVDAADETAVDGSTRESGIEGGVDAGDDARRCTMAFECAIGCAGTLPSCSCEPYFAGTTPPVCDTTCAGACNVKTPACSDAGICYAK